MHPYISVGPYVFESYTLITNLGTLLGIAAAYGIQERYCKKGERCWILIPVLLVLMVVGAPIAHFLKGLFGGNVAPGATHFLGRVFPAAVILSYLVPKIWKNVETSFQVLNAAAAYFVVQHFFNRIACWMNGCCGGVYLKGLNGHFCSQLFEAGAMLVIGCVLLAHIRKKKPFFTQTCLLYATVIFASEFLIDQPEIGKIAGLTSIQASAVVMVIWLSLIARPALPFRSGRTAG